MVDPAKLAEQLTHEVGVEITGELLYDKRGTLVSFRPVGLPKAHGFSVQVLLKWRSAEAEFIPDAYAVEIVRAMQESWTKNRLLFQSFVSSTTAAGIKLSILIAGEPPESISSVGKTWTSVEIRMSLSPVVIERNKPETSSSVVRQMASRVFGLALSLLPVEPVDQEVAEREAGVPEGALTRVEVNKYERSPLNRMACLQIHGTSCKACGLRFEAVYGLIGDGYIHVHHTTPVSELGPDYAIDPSNDLVPLCPNCHAMVHKRTPPYSVAELRNIMLSQSALKSSPPAI